MSTAPRPTTCLLAGCLSLAALVATADEANDKLFARLDANADRLLDASEVDAEHGRLFDRLIRRADRDNDGRLSPAEFAAGLTPSAPPKPIVDEPADSNPGADALRLMLLKLDANRDGMLTKAEAPDHLADAFDQLASVVDQDGNNRIIYRELVQASRPATQAAVRVARRERWDVASELKRVTAEQGDDAKRFDAPPNPRAALGSRARMEDLFTQLDANADGRLRLDELPEQYRGQLGRLVRVADRDSSGDVSLEEFLTQSQRAARILAMAEQRQGAPSDDAPRDDLAGGMMAEDSNAEDSMADDSMADDSMADDSMADDSMRGADAPSSRRPRQQAQGQAENGRSLRRALAALDRNGDGMIQAAEASGPLKRRFDRLDANADGQLDPGELRRAAQQRQRQASPADRPRNQSEKP